MGVADPAFQVRAADALVRLARDLVSGCIGNQSVGLAADATLAATGLAWVGGSSRRHARLRVFLAQFLPALIGTFDRVWRSNANVKNDATRFSDCRLFDGPDADRVRRRG